MKRKDIQELKSRPKAELERLLKDERERLRNVRFDLAAGKLKDIGEMRRAKKTVARILTFLKDKQP